MAEREAVYMREDTKEVVVVKFPADSPAAPLADGALEITPLGYGMGRIDIHTEAIHTDGVVHISLGPDAPIIVRVGESLASLQSAAPLYVCGWDGDEGSIAQQAVLLESEQSIQCKDAHTWMLQSVHVTDHAGNELTDEELGRLGIESSDLYGFKNAKADELLRVSHVIDGLQAIQGMIANVSIRTEIMEDGNKPVTIRSGADFSQFVRGATKRTKTRGIVLKNRSGKEVTRITAIEDFLELKPSGRKTMVKLNQEATRLSQSGEYRHDGETVCRVVLGVMETARQYGITEASARKRLRKDFKAIANESITVKHGNSWATIPVAGGAFGIRGDNAFFTLSPDFMKVMLGPKRPQLDLPPEIYGTDDANYPAALQIGFKLYNHDNMNFGRPNQDRMSLEALLHAATELPRAGTVNRHETEKIMGPFEATMDHLVSKGVLKAWDYCHENGEPLTDEELETIQTEHDLGKPTPWAMAQGLLVTWELGKRYQQNEEARQASRDRRRAAALEAKAEKEKEAKAREKRIRGKVETMEAKSRYKEAKKADA